MQERERRVTPWMLAVVGVGLTLLVFVMFDVRTDRQTVGTPLYASLAENAPLVVLSLVVVAAGAWLWYGGFAPGRQQTVAAWAFVGTAAMAVGMTWVVTIQHRLQVGIQPYVIVVDAVVLGSFFALGTGLYNARAERERAKLERERDRFAALFDNAPGGVARVVPGDDGPVVEAVNPAFADVFGYGDEEAVGRPVDGLFVPDTAERSVAAELFEGDADAGRERELTLETDDGRREFLCVTAPIGSDEGRVRGWYVVFLDVTERNQQAERLKVLSRTLRHDIRNDLNVVSGHATMLDDRLDDAESVDRIAEKTDRIFDLAERTRSIEQAVRGDTPQVTQSVSDIVADAVDAARDADAAVQVDVPDGLYVCAHTDIDRAVRELVENAVGHNGGDDQWVEVTAHADTDDYVTVVVGDNGPGVPSREYEVITGQREHTQIEHPTGIGLWMVDWLVTDSGGSTEFATGEDGTTVRLRLPRGTPDTGKAATPVPVAPTRSDPEPSARR